MCYAQLYYPDVRECTVYLRARVCVLVWVLVAVAIDMAKADISNKQKAKSEHSVIIGFPVTGCHTFS